MFAAYSFKTHMIISRSILVTTARRAIFQCGARGAVFRDTLNNTACYSHLSLTACSVIILPPWQRIAVARWQGVGVAHNPYNCIGLYSRNDMFYWLVRVMQRCVLSAKCKHSRWQHKVCPWQRTRAMPCSHGWKVVHGTGRHSRPVLNYGEVMSEIT